MDDGHDIFISYSREDRARVGVLADALQRQGWRVWWDRKLLPGDTFDRVIAGALASAKVVVVAWSKISVDRDWVLNEADDGRRRNILVPVCIDVVEIPLGFRRVQAADLSGWKGAPDDPELINLFARIATLLGQPAPVVAAAAKKPRKLSPASLGMIAGAGILGAVLLVAAVFLRNGTVGASRTIQGIVDCPLCPELMSVPAGDFQMGSTEGDPHFNPSEGPKRKVAIAKPFLIGRYEITVAEFAEFVREQGQVVEGPGCSYYDYRSSQFRLQSGTGWKNPPVFSQQNNHPVVCVSWLDAKSYVAWLSRKTGKRYRLPSEAEWEYAARAGESDAWPWGRNAHDACGLANVADESSKRRTEFNWEYHRCDDSYPFTAPVGSFQANDFRLHDMIGNVWEWVEDCYVAGYDDAPADGAVRLADNCAERILRGASWLSRPVDTRFAARGRNDPKGRYYAVGFRVVREP
jgi:formylglycine-generating enzyme required for sulfatase activity